MKNNFANIPIKIKAKDEKINANKQYLSTLKPKSRLKVSVLKKVNENFLNTLPNKLDTDELNENQLLFIIYYYSRHIISNIKIHQKI